MTGISSQGDDAVSLLGHEGHGGGGDDDGTSPRLDLLQKRVPEDLFVERQVHDLNAAKVGGRLSAVEADAMGGSAAGVSSSHLYAGGRIPAPRVAAAAAAEPTDALGHRGDDTCPLLDIIKRHPDLFERRCSSGWIQRTAPSSGRWTRLAGRRWWAPTSRAQGREWACGS
jgi:hypothetical protein